jgi:hypothetical protein
MEFRTSRVYRTLEIYDSHPSYFSPNPSLFYVHKYHNVLLLCFFDFYLKNCEQVLSIWVRLRAGDANRDNGGNLYDVVNFHIADEPNGSYGHTMRSELFTTTNIFDQNKFNFYLQSRGSAVNIPTFSYHSSPDPTTDLNNRKLFYWSMRYFVVID